MPRWKGRPCRRLKASRCRLMLVHLLEIETCCLACEAKQSNSGTCMHNLNDCRNKETSRYKEEACVCSGVLRKQPAVPHAEFLG